MWSLRASVSLTSCAACRPLRRAVGRRSACRCPGDTGTLPCQVPILRMSGVLRGEAFATGVRYRACLLTSPTGTAVTCCPPRSEEHTSELQSRFDLVCRLLLEKKKLTSRDHHLTRT